MKRFIPLAVLGVLIVVVLANVLTAGHGHVEVVQDNEVLVETNTQLNATVTSLKHENTKLKQENQALEQQVSTLTDQINTPTLPMPATVPKIDKWYDPHDVYDNLINVLHRTPTREEYVKELHKLCNSNQLYWSDRYSDGPGMKIVAADIEKISKIKYN
jgi:cell division protein FtsB